jgi:hypothetical protein
MTTEVTMSALVRTITGSVELNGPKVPRRRPTPDADGIIRLRRGESVALAPGHTLHAV